MNAVIIFTDIIESSKYSSILGIEQYAENIIIFQTTFQEVATKYFTDNSLLANSYVKRDRRGDEGSIFIVPDNEVDVADIIYLAVQFAFELKARLNVRFPDDTSMRKMQIATGIHFGEVATILDNKITKYPANQIESSGAEIQGYTINYAKRIESSSRHGRHSLIFLSKTANSFLSYKPVVSLHYELDLKGISLKEDVYEVRSALCRDFTLDFKNEDELDKFIGKYVNGNYLDLIEHSWLKSFIVSVLESIRAKQSDPVIKEKYWQKISDFIWIEHAEDDPIIIFARALDCGNNCNHTREVSLLRELIEAYPSFIYAKRQLVHAISNVADHAQLSSELVYARDIAKELYDKYPHALGNNDKRKDFEKIIEKIETLLKS
ncbi:MAG: hypothetical protein ACFFG0_45015 [Candidatus Thorarchaeota archaeon]